MTASYDVSGGEARTDPDLSLLQRVAYGFGHVYNDLCAAMWFSYTLFYLQIVIRMTATSAGLLVMIGERVRACVRACSCALCLCERAYECVSECGCVYARVPK